MVLCIMDNLFIMLPIGIVPTLTQSYFLPNQLTGLLEMDKIRLECNFSYMILISSNMTYVKPHAVKERFISLATFCPHWHLLYSQHTEGSSYGKALQPASVSHHQWGFSDDKLEGTFPGTSPGSQALLIHET